ncbi:MAG: DHH family phosphoesterase [Candidatus Methanomethylophilaceae archaeon]|nr:DHH family phosphoesterase [Candidatus Methanomethylophilaceae archaeon]
MRNISPELEKDVLEAARTVHESDDVLIVSHIDADGISSAGIAYTACKRSKIHKLTQRLMGQANSTLTEEELEQKLESALSNDNLVGEHRLARCASIISSSERLLSSGCSDEGSVRAILQRAKEELDTFVDKETDKKIRVLFAKKMDPDTIKKIQNDPSSLIWICDLGSGYKSQFCKDKLLITDHHIPDTNGHPKSQSCTQTKLWFTFNISEINPINYGLEGSTEGCGATVTYLVARAMDKDNIDLAQLAVVGACGDMQDHAIKGLSGINSIALKDAVENGDVSVEDDLRFFGRETRTVINYLKYSNNPTIPEISDNGVGCSRLLKALDIPIKDGSSFRTWNDLNKDEKSRITDFVLSKLNGDEQSNAFGQTYTLPKYPRHTEYRDAKEFATMLNSCGRYDDPETGMEVCVARHNAGKELLDKAKKHRSEHTENINRCTQLILEKQMVKICRGTLYFHAHDMIEETVVGIVVGSILSRNPHKYDMPMMGFVDTDDGVKVSARSDRNLVNRGLNLSAVMNIAAEHVGGYGGGHNIAAGATIPKGMERKFLDVANDIILTQID